MNYQNNNEIKRHKTKEIFVAIIATLSLIGVGILIIVFLYIFLKNKLLNTVEKYEPTFTAYSIMYSVESAYLDVVEILDKNNRDVMTIEEIRKEYSNSLSTWNEDNTIKPDDYDFICNVTVNQSNGMVVSCDVDGESIESNPLPLKLEKNSENTGNNTENNNTGNNTQNNNIQNNQTNNKKYDKWMNYLLNTNIQKIEIGRNIDSWDWDITLTKAQLKESFEKMKGYTLKKAYVTGLGGPDMDYLNVTYKVGLKTYEFHIGYGHMISISTLDEVMINMLDESVSVIENEQYKNNKNYTCIYYFEPDVTAVFDEYYEKEKALDSTYGMMKAAENYCLNQLLDNPTKEFPGKAFTFDGKTIPEELSLKTKSNIVGSITVTKSCDSYIGTYNTNTKKYEGILVVNGYTCKQVEKTNPTKYDKYDVVCEK